LEEELLEKIAKEMNIPVEAIKKKAINIVSSTFQDGASVGGFLHYNPTFNPLDKVVELYDQIIQEKNERISFLEQILKEKR
jgi:hypothetical protein